MRQISFSAEAFTPFETVWELMCDRIEHPNGYLPGAEEIRIIEWHEDVLVREVRAHGLVIKERVTIDKGKGEIRYMLLEHPPLLWHRYSPRGPALPGQPQYDRRLGAGK